MSLCSLRFSCSCDFPRCPVSSWSNAYKKRNPAEGNKRLRTKSSWTKRKPWQMQDTTSTCFPSGSDNPKQWSCQLCDKFWLVLPLAYCRMTREAEANKAKLTDAFLELKFIEAITNNTKIFFGEKVGSHLLCLLDVSSIIVKPFHSFMFLDINGHYLFLKTIELSVACRSRHWWTIEYWHIGIQESNSLFSHMACTMCMCTTHTRQ